MSFVLENFRKGRDQHPLLAAAAVVVFVNMFLLVSPYMEEAVIHMTSFVSGDKVWAVEACVIGALVMVLLWCQPDKQGTFKFRKCGNQKECSFDSTKEETPFSSPDQEETEQLIRTCVKNGEVAHAESLLRNLPEPTVELCSLVRDAYIRLNNLVHAERLSVWVINAGIQPDTMFIGAMINGYAKRHQVKQAEHWYAQLAVLGLEPNRCCYLGMLTACAKIGDTDLAMVWLSRMQAAGIQLDHVTYTILLDACANAQDLPKAQRVFSAMLKSGMNLNAYPYTCLARLHAVRGEYLLVETLFTDMQAAGIPMNEYCLSILLQVYGRAVPRQEERAERAFRKALSENIPINAKVLQCLKFSTGVARAKVLRDEARLRSTK